MSQVDLETIREQFVGVEFDERHFNVEADKMAAYAAACGETAARYTDPTHEDFQAPPTFASSLQQGRRRPEGFPKLLGLGMDAGKAVEAFLPIRPGPLIGKSHLHDVYAKTGRSGRMIFLVTRMEVYNEAGELLANADTRAVIREKPDAEEQA